jgi:hypothetical protein
MILALWRDVREAYYDALRKWIAHDTDAAILLLRVAVKRTEILIAALEKGIGNGKISNR